MILIALKIIKVIELVFMIIRIINGPSFWSVLSIKHPIHLSDIITKGTHWKNGNNPSFIIILKINIFILKLLIIRNDIKYIADPVTWAKKYLVIPSIVIEFIVNKGKNPNNDSSKPTHIKNQFLLLVMIVNEVRITIR